MTKKLLVTEPIPQGENLNLIEEYKLVRDRQAEIELEYCKRNMTCIECSLFNHCVTASMYPNGIRK